MSTIIIFFNFFEECEWVNVTKKMESMDDEISYCESNIFKIAYSKTINETVSFSEDKESAFLGYITENDFIHLRSTLNIKKEPVSKCEVLKEMVRKYGYQSLSVLSGSFCFIDYNSNTKTVSVIRDRIGLVTLFACKAGNGWIFSTRIKFLLELSFLSYNLNRNTIQHYQYCGWSPRGASFLESIMNCEPGAITTFCYNNYSTILLNLPEKKAIPDDLLNAASTIKKNLEIAISHHIPSNKRIGIAVSGGIDSVYMTSLVKKTIGERPLLTFSYGYDEYDPNIVGGKQISEFLNCEHTSVITYPHEIPQLLIDSIAHLEEPVGRDQYLMLTKMAKVARGKVDTLITGNCGDAVFGSPPLAKYLLKASKWPFLRSFYQDIATEDYSGALPESVAGKLYLKFLKKVKTPAAAKIIGSLGVENRIILPNQTPPLLKMLEHDLQYAPGEQGIKSNLLYDMAKLELRQPYADISLLKMGLSIPDQWRFDGKTYKIALRMSAKNDIPENLIWAPKGVARLKHDDRLWEIISDLIHNKITPEKIKSRGIYEKESLDKLLKIPNRNKRTMRWLYRLWYIIALEIWCEIFIDHKK
ncbi:asparagine synthase-related protein [Pantoea ananatis]|uniref:asparagine synthase-related protein n=2 Tax=Pantoea ananas TaxID=553 RepID=UPI00091FC120|nr:asparagine synthase-related protein [Pantoea ananatis]MDJ0029818.1 asparagine synthase-related protein [Pantoea ananatis]MDJ0045371.1 asparagine synthase-related protein [Pantoea ananatis]NCU09149.1 DUF1933 domain-containing protein [Pantoea ananatis]SFX01469.1 asparagine synthase (glutamine-hydrolysing) [Pantoea ananatis]